MKEEVDNIIKLLKVHGSLVDVNFDYFPHFIVPTYVKLESASSLIHSYEPKFETKNGPVIVKPWQINFIIPIRNQRVNSSNYLDSE